ncbi:hypothetical protein H8F21_13845 [Pseudomonas sp. P66]|uniref:Uncharacterized protein n=1 Tax=Pseudomonas arcuscaelestis TaxID=2710591 RepID=A0ABS2C009_9PSED|nr:hypothetical protein [Pseudomonas arcuscaelestis]MBM5458648.1 hypothetical protein [Pseudomonas arcuscaelestis]
MSLLSFKAILAYWFAGVAVIGAVSYFSGQPQFKRAPSVDVVELIERTKYLPEARQVLMDTFAREGSLDLTVSELDAVKATVDRLQLDETTRTYMLLLSLMNFGDSSIDNEMRSSACSGLNAGYQARGMEVPQVLAKACDPRRLSDAVKPE